MPGLRQPRARSGTALADGAKFLDLRYPCAAGARRYRLYVPSSATAMLRDAGWAVNASASNGWRREGLKVPQKQPKRSVSG